MELPVTQVYRLLTNLTLKWLDNIYLMSIPDEAQDGTTTTDILLTEYQNEPTFYANRQFKGMALGVEVQVFYKLDLPDEFDMMTDEIELMQAFKSAGWLIEQSKNHIQDPDTDQLSKVFYLTKNETLK